MNFRHIVTLCILFLTGLSAHLFADAFILSQKDVRETMEEMFAYHVENRDFSPLVIRRSFKVYIGQFDPDRLYLLKKEVEPFFSLSEQKVNQVNRDYLRDRFPDYKRLNQVIQQIIIRNREIRQKQIEKIIREGVAGLKRKLPAEGDDYVSSLKELKERVYCHLVKEVVYTMKERGIKEVSKEIIQKILYFREQKTALMEDPYLPQGEELDNHYLTLHILKALAKSLDSHSGYYSPEEAYEIRANLKKEFSGIGIVLREDFDGISVADLIKGGPADRCGKIEVGDSLVGLNHESTQNKNFNQILEIMKGKAGTRLTLNLKKRENDKLLNIDLIREKIIMNGERLSLEIEPFADGVIGKINMPGFYDNGGQVSAEKDLREALRTLRNEGKVYGIILDLRENSGGFLTQAIKVSAMFINGGIIVVSKYADGKVSYARDVDGRHYYSGPFVILTSKASASAAEIVAGALQDHGVALIAGDDRSYGKGSMQYQTLTDENAHTFFKVTLGRYYTASGRSPQINGVKSDLLVPTIFHPYNIGERYLEYPISNDNLSGQVFHSLATIKKGSFRGRPSFSIPYLSPHPSEWRQMLLQLQENSQKRLSTDQNFQFFLKVANGYHSKRSRFQSRSESRKANYGIDDLQMKEAVEVIKDMSMISSQAVP